MKNDISVWLSNNKTTLRHSILNIISYGSDENHAREHAKGLVKTFLEESFGDFFNISYKNIGVDDFNKEEKNIIFVPCMHEDTIIDFFKNTPDEVYNFSKENNLKIILGFTREHPNTSETKWFDYYYEKYCLNDELKSKSIKILINGFEKSTLTKYPDLYIFINMFDRLMRAFVNKGLVRKAYPFIEKRNYDFSFLIGSLNRMERVLFLKDCLEGGLIDDRFFYSSICLNKQETIDMLMEDLEPKEKLDIQETLEKFLYHRVYNDNGMPLLQNEHIYHQQHEFKIPIQVSNSYINIVFETRQDVPSITEKIYKPIIAGIPFVWFGPQNVLKFLKSKGYKQYPFINYIFDVFNDRDMRMYSLTKEIKRLKTLDLKECVNECKDISRHNQNVFFETTENFDDLYFKLNEYF